MNRTSAGTCSGVRERAVTPTVIAEANPVSSQGTEWVHDRLSWLRQEQRRVPAPLEYVLATCKENVLADFRIVQNKSKMPQL